VGGDGGGAGAVEPEALAGFRRHRDEAFAAAGVGQPHDVRGSFARGIFAVGHDVDQQHHVRTAGTRRLGGVADRLDVAGVEMLQTGQQHIGIAVAVVLDLDDRRHGFGDLAEELQADRTGVCRQAMEDEARRGDEAVAAFLLDARQAGEKLVGDVLAEAGLAEAAAGDGEDFRRSLRRPAVRGEAADLEGGEGSVVDLAEVVVEADDLDPVGIRGDHAPRCQVVERGAPQYRLLAAGVHRHVAADGRGIGRGRVDREYQPGGLGGFHHALGHHPGAAVDRRHLEVESRQMLHFDFAEGFELFGVDHRGLGGQRDRTTGIAGAAAARDDGESELDQAGDQRGHFGFAVGGQHDEGVFHPPVGGVGDVRDPCQAVEGDVVAAGDMAETAQDGLAQAGRLAEPGLEVAHRVGRRRQQLAHQFVALARRTPVP